MRMLWLSWIKLYGLPESCGEKSAQGVAWISGLAGKSQTSYSSSRSILDRCFGYVLIFSSTVANSDDCHHMIPVSISENDVSGMREELDETFPSLSLIAHLPSPHLIPRPLILPSPVIPEPPNNQRRPSRNQAGIIHRPHRQRHLGRKTENHHKNGEIRTADPVPCIPYPSFHPEPAWLHVLASA